MPAALLVRFRPAGPWRLGPDNGARDRTARILHSDALYSALTLAMRDLGFVDEWIAATAQGNGGEPGIRLSSCFPWTGRLLLIQPPRHLWPVNQTGKVRWKSARFVPVSLIPALIRGESLPEDQWAVDPVSECLLPVTKGGPLHPPFRVVHRRMAPIDRVTGTSEFGHDVACLQFAPVSGMWFASTFASDEVRHIWFNRIRGACRLLADSGIGGGKSRGWGRSEEPRVEAPADLGRMLTGTASTDAPGDNQERAWWLLSLFSPSEQDSVDWKRGFYSVCVRSGRVVTQASTAEMKPGMQMVTEGSVLLSGSPLAGAAGSMTVPNVDHPVFRSGIALAIPIAWKESRRLPWLEPETTAAPGISPQAETAVQPESEADAVPHPGEFVTPVSSEPDREQLDPVSPDVHLAADSEPAHHPTQSPEQSAREPESMTEPDSPPRSSSNVESAMPEPEQFSEGAPPPEAPPNTETDPVPVQEPPSGEPPVREPEPPGEPEPPEGPAQ